MFTQNYNKFLKIFIKPKNYKLFKIINYTYCVNLLYFNINNIIIF